MLDKRLALTGAALVIVSAASYLAVKPPLPPRQLSAAVSVATSAAAVPEAAPDTEYMYTIREYDGFIAVYPAGEAEPELVLDIPVQYLPELDRRQMAEGVPVKDYNELVRLLEDYSS